MCNKDENVYNHLQWKFLLDCSRHLDAKRVDEDKPKQPK
jgi:hypothetical protein